MSMMWKTYQNPKPGTQQFRRMWALWPVALDNGYTVWLESYYVTEKWGPGQGWDETGGWRTVALTKHHPERPDTGSVNQ